MNLLHHIKFRNIYNTQNQLHLQKLYLDIAFHHSQNFPTLGLVILSGHPIFQIFSSNPILFKSTIYLCLVFYQVFTLNKSFTQNGSALNGYDPERGSNTTYGGPTRKAGLARARAMKCTSPRVFIHKPTRSFNAEITNYGIH